MKNKKIYILFSILIAIFCITLVSKTIPNDTFSSIKIGDYILHNGIDFVEHFNFNELVYHNARWLFNVIMTLIYNKFNFFGIYIFTIINSIILGLIMFNASYKRTKNLLVSFLITLISMEFAGTAIVPRAQTISYILLLLEIIFVEKMLDENRIKYLFILLPISILIANIHTTIWLMTLILFLPYFAEYFISKITKKTKVFYSNKNNIKLLIISFIVIAVSGFLTPLGLTPYTYMFKTLSGFSSTFILELQKGNVFFNFSLLIPFLIYIYLFVYKRNKIKISDFFMVLGLFIMSIMAIRNIPLFIILGFICLSRLFKDNIKFEIFDIVFESKIFIFLIPILVILLSLVFLFKNTYKKNYVDEKMYPTKASDYIVKNLDLKDLRLYNDFDTGAYLEFKGIKVFVDSRSEIYCKEFNNTAILVDWYNVNRLKANYKSIFNKYDFNYVLLYQTEPLNNYVSSDEDYKVIYMDQYFVLYEKVK